MAYPYYPSMTPYQTMQPYSNPYTSYQQQQPQQFQQQQQTQQPSGVIRVNGIDGAKAYQMPPNYAVALFDQNDPLLYLKTTDGAGFPTIDVFDISKHVEKAPDIGLDFASLATDFDDRIKRLEEVINNGEPGAGLNAKNATAKRPAANRAAEPTANA